MRKTEKTEKLHGRRSTLLSKYPPSGKSTVSKPIASNGFFPPFSAWVTHLRTEHNEVRPRTNRRNAKIVAVGKNPSGDGFVGRALLTASANGSRRVSVVSCGSAGPSSASGAVVPLAVSLWPSTSLLFGTSVFATGEQPAGWEKRIERESGGVRTAEARTGKRGSSRRRGTRASNVGGRGGGPSCEARAVLRGRRIATLNDHRLRSADND
ncbi:hypothetical protein AGLY_004645 [Aphis glycines]|uniref:Uncharacterized protein n=1 Tax=Aphis glycines TaxID=307491 RepID=A0A6G0TWV4_APHGL|nr:hypothetical protein AGLY_004645 [Aphis glycines]